MILPNRHLYCRLALSELTSHKKTLNYKLNVQKTAIGVTENKQGKKFKDLSLLIHSLILMFPIIFNFTS